MSDTRRDDSIASEVMPFLKASAASFLVLMIPVLSARAQSNYSTPYTFSTLAGTLGVSESVDGTGSAAQFWYPYGLASDGNGNLYVADAQSIRLVTSGGMVTTLAGAGGGEGGNMDGSGAAARFLACAGVAVDLSGNIFVADTDNNTIREVTSGGEVTTLAGNAGPPGSADGTGVAASFYYPWELAVDGNDNIYVADSNNHTIRKVTLAGIVTTFAGSAGSSGSVDGTGSAARFKYPHGLAVDSAGNVYVADTGNVTIRRITPNGSVTTIAGLAGNYGSADGTGSAAQFNLPTALTVDSAGNVFVADRGNDTVRKITPSGVVTTLGGTAGIVGSSNGTGSEASFNSPSGITVDGAGNLYVADTMNYTIRVGRASAVNAPTPLPTPIPVAARLINISTRALVGMGGNILIPGFVIRGNGLETLLIRADGPSLAQFGVTGLLQAPVLNVFNNAGVSIATNTGWSTSANASQIASTASTAGAFAFAAGSADSAVLLSLPAGAYTVQVSGQNGTTGVALAEVYEVSTTGTRLINIATRAQVGTGGNLLIAGFVVRGAGTEQLIVRADGPSLAQFGVTGVLANPSLSVLSGTTVIASNTGWGTATNPATIASTASTVGAFPFAANSPDSAQIVNLSAGAYTMEVNGVGGTTGVGLAEVYEVAP